MRIHTSLGNLYVEQEGHGPVVVLWHSFLCHGGMWGDLFQALKTQFSVVNIDAPGHGRSEQIHREFSLKECAQAAFEVMDQLSIERASFVGLSWGGMTAMHAALLDPCRVDKLVLCDTSCRNEPLWNRSKYALMGKIVRNLGYVPWLRPLMLQIMFSPRTIRHHESIADHWYADMLGLDRESVLCCLRCIMSRPNIEHDLQRVRSKTLVLVGEDDKAQPVSEAKKIAHAIRDARLEIVKNAGHLIALEQPHVTTRLVQEFLLG